jgi:hypothetical protein
MKKYWFATILAILTLLAHGAQADVLFVENFDYDAGVLGDSAGQANVSGGNWVHFSGGGLLIECVDGNLTYPSYPASDIGRMIQILRHTPGATAEDVYRQFTTQAPGVTVYASFLFRVTHDSMSPDTATHGQYWTMLMNTSSTTNHYGRITTKMGSTAGKYKLGLRATSSNSATLWTSGEYDVNTTYLVVLGYEFIAGNTNDVAKLWINPVIGGSEPTPDLMQTSALTTDPSDLARLAIRQGSTSSTQLVTPSANIDGIQVVTSWSEITGVAGSPTGLTNARFSLQPVTPNPVSKSTQIQYSLQAPGRVNLAVFNILGQQMATLVDGNQTAGSHSVSWRLRDDRGSMVPNGVYFVKLSANGQNITRRAMVVR